MKTIKLNNGIEMPVLGFGVFQIPDLAICEQAVSDAIETGYRLIDTAAAYGNEQAVGNAIIKSGVSREDFFVTTKIWIQDTGYESTLKAFERSIHNLQLNYLDLLLLHQPYGDIFGSWRAMQELYKQGKVRAIGVANFHPDRIADLISNSGFTPAINQIETHPFLQQSETQKFLEQNNVQHQSWGPFAEGKNNIFNNEILTDIAKQYDKTVAQVILHWLIQRNIIAIPKSVLKQRMAENFNIFDFELSGDDLRAIQTLDTNTSLFFDHRDPNMVKWLSESKLDL